MPCRDGPGSMRQRGRTDADPRDPERNRQSIFQAVVPQDSRSGFVRSEVQILSPRLQVIVLKKVARPLQFVSWPARRILLGWRVEEDARIDTEVAGQDADVPGIEPAPAQEDLRQRRLGQPRLRGDGRLRLAARLDQVPQSVEA